MGELFWQGDPSRDLRILWNRLPHIPALKLLFYPKIPKLWLVQALVCVGALQQTRRRAGRDIKPHFQGVNTHQNLCKDISAHLPYLI